MLYDRINPVHWDWLVYVEMFVAGIAAGAFVTAALLELTGRGRSPLVRIAHLVSFPLVLLATLFLIIDLGRPERFWHMILQSKTFVPALKLWSPISFGTYVLGLFGVLSFVTFVDALLDGRLLRQATLRRVWIIVGGIVAFMLAAYSGVLLSATNIPGWGETTLIGALFVAIAMATGMATVLLLGALGGRGEADVRDLARTNALLVAWELVMLAIFVVSLGGQARQVFLSGGPLVAIVGAALVGGIVPLVLYLAASRAGRPLIALTSVLVLLGGLLLRYAIVMGPQQY